MDVTDTNRQDSAAQIEQLAETLCRYAASGLLENHGVPGLHLNVLTQAQPVQHCFYTPSVTLVLQGRKQVTVGSRRFEYGQGECLVTGTDVPSAFCIPHCSSAQPFVAVSLTIDPLMLSELIPLLPREQAAGIQHSSMNAVSVAPIDPGMLHTMAQLVQLVKTPERVPLRAPILTRDCLSLLLLGSQGAGVLRLYTRDSHANRIARAIGWLRQHYTQPVAVEELAQKTHMSASSFHRHFRQVTSQSPLQYLKQLRLYEAQRLLLTHGSDVGAVAYAVGYVSAAQFSRDYKAQFGLPPARDRALRQAAAADGG